VSSTSASKASIRDCFNSAAADEATSWSRSFTAATHTVDAPAGSVDMDKRERVGEVRFVFSVCLSVHDRDATRRARTMGVVRFIATSRGMWDWRTTGNVGRTSTTGTREPPTGWDEGREYKEPLHTTLLECLENAQPTFITRYRRTQRATPVPVAELGN